MDGHNFERLKEHILSLSVANDFNAARREWSLDHVELSDEFDNCPCGQRIKEHCFIRNRLNASTTYVGNVCINQFIGIATGNLFEGLRRIKEDPKANANLEVIEYADRMGYLFENERQFLLSTVRKRKRSEKVVTWKEKINRRIIAQTVVSRRGQGH